MTNDVRTEERIAEITLNLGRLFEDQHSVELRCIQPEGPAASGFFDDHEALAAHALAMEAEGYACYFGLAPRNPKQCFPDNELRGGKAAGVEVVLRRRWLLVDSDPVRKGGVGSTDEEKAAAESVLLAAVKWLQDVQGWPQPLLADSGNGHHALFRIDLPADDGGIVERCLRAIAARCSTTQVKIDTIVFDSPRICRLYGTSNCKGENTPERPHRISRLFDGGGTEVASREDLLRVSQLAPKSIPKTFSRLPTNSAVPPSDQSHGAVAMAEMLNDERDDDRPALEADDIIEIARAWMNSQPLAVSGDGGDKQTFKIACGLVVGHGLTVDEALPLMEEYNEKLVLNGQEEWSDDQLEHKLDYAAKEVGKQPDRVGCLLHKSKVDGGEGNEDDGKGSQAAMLMSIIESQELWHTPDKKCFATVTVKRHRENLNVHSKSFEHWLGGECYATFGTIAKSQPRAEAIDTAVGLALHTGECYPVFTRLAQDARKLYLDLGNEKWEVVEIDDEGWRVVTDPPVKFRRTPGMQALPTPVKGGNIQELRPFLNLARDEDFVLVVAWLVMGFHPRGEFPILVFGGQQGTSKSTMARVARSLLDPNEAELRSVPRSEDDFAVEAYNNRVLVFDNLSYVSDWMSDALCRLASGGANSKRQLYTDTDETIVRYCGPAIINGVVDLARRPDLLDRCILIDLPVLKRTATKSAFWSGFEQVRPRVLGALLDAVSFALSAQKQIDEPPRMAEFAEWIHSAEPLLAQQWNKDFAAAKRRHDEHVSKLERAAELAARKALTETDPDEKMRLASLADKVAKLAERETYNVPFKWEPGAFIKLYRENIIKAKKSGLDQSPIVPVLQDLVERKGKWKGTSTSLLKELNQCTGGTRISQSKGWPKDAQRLGIQLQRIAPSLAAIGIIAESGHSGERYWILRKK